MRPSTTRRPRAAAQRTGAAALALLLTAACSTPPASPSLADRPDAPAARLNSLTATDQRVAAVAWRLSTANVELCPVVRPRAGWALHASSQYGDDLRPLAERRFGLEGDLPGLLHVADESPAAAAGLRQGDLIIAVDGEPLARGPAAPLPSFDGLAANIAVLDAAVARGTVRLTVRRAGAERIVTVEPTPACAYFFQVNPSTEYNARADGRGVFISSTMAAFTAADDDLALILGHEMAHNVLQHQATRDGEDTAALAAAVPPGALRTAERDADRVGLYLAARAGYAVEDAPGFWRRFAEAHWWARYPQIGHPSAGVRARALERVLDEISEKRAAGQPLLP